MTSVVGFIEVPGKENYKELITVWEAAVRATHYFLTEEDICFIKPLLLEQYFDAVQLHCIRIDKNVTAFIGTSDNKIEMLFVHPSYHGHGMGKRLMNFAVNHLHKTLVDVNEQNMQAVGFYQHLGFSVIGRTEKDGLGKPYPILQMQLLK
jgi:putative acetyltransferase